ADSLKTLGRKEGASLFMVLLAAFKVLLHRLAGEEDVVIGSPIAGRGRGELEGLIGMFLNTLVLRTSLAGDPSVRELLERVREMALDAYAHQDVPFEMLLDELRVERDLSRTPLFQVFFNMLNLPAGETRLPGLTLESLPSPDLPSKFDLTLYVQPLPDGIRFDMAYNGDLFDPERIELLLEQLAGLLARFGKDPEARIGSLSLLTPGAMATLPDPRASLGEEWHGAVHEKLTFHARREPGRLALRDRDSSWTYGELEARSNRLAHALVAAGLEPESPVAIYAHRSATLVWAVLGALKAGGAFTILDPAYPPARLRAILELASPRAFLRLAEAGPLPAELEEHLGSRPECIRLDLMPAAPEEKTLAGEAAEPPAVRVGADHVAVLGFTSGSTGLPKGILGRHGPLSHFLPWQVERFGLCAGDRFSMLSGLSHDPLQRDIFTPLWLGAALSIPEPRDMGTPGRLAEWMRREKISIAHLTPAMAQILTERPAGAPEIEIPSLRFVLLVGDVLTRRDVVRLRRLAPGVTVVNLYGSTETQRAVAFHVVPEETGGAAREVLPLGRGMRDVQLLVVNAAGELAGIGEVGEIWVRSPHLARGYLGDEALTADRFRVNPFTGSPRDRVYRTGDLGRYLLDGEVTFVSRADQQVKIRGFRIEPGEIEALLGRLPGVREAIVLARGDSAADKRLVAYVTPDPTAGEVPTTARMRTFLKERLPAYMVPSAFVVLDRLPVTPNGKVDRKALLRIDDRQRETDVDYKAPQTEAELTVAAILQDVLKVERVGADDNFFDLGGNSLLLVQVHGRLQEQFGREILLVEIFNNPTVRALAAHLKGGEAPAGPTPSSDRSEQLRQGRDRLRRRLQQQKG
ncbi:MAG TPA: amino acid adenylation domain-containing protein, partial [Thermoanaerobaculia bacterium]|nr:amino acid adenylation domain-containing protein [Thermoanaerobaculia bacterium]